MSQPAPTDDELQQALRRLRSERRAVVRRLHPDRGGDPRLLREALDRLDALERSLRRPPESDPGPVLDPGSRVRRVVRRAGAHGTRVVRRGRALVPPGWPGSRRYVHL